MKRGEGDSLALKLRDIRTEVIREKDGSYAVVCSALGVYSVGKTLREAKRNFEEALDLHLSVLRQKATKQIAAIAPHR
jgi:predicted RNase H-like HicB family nuclease